MWVHTGRVRAAVAVAGAVALTAAVGASGLHRLRPAGPALGWPQTVDLGERERGSVAEARFELRNDGGGVLHLDDFRSDCSCNVLEVEAEGRFVPLKRIRLAGGDTAVVRLRKSVAGLAGQPLRSIVRFRTTDPDNPEAAVEIVVTRVLGGLTVSPPNWVVGTVPQGATVCRDFDLADTTTPPRAVDRVESSDPARLRVTLVRPAAGTDPTSAGRLSVCLDTGRPGPVNASIRLYTSGGKSEPDAILVTGRVTAPVECTPARMALPRRSSGGLLYEATCLVRATAGRPLDLRPDVTPAGVRVTVEPVEPGGPVRAVRVSCDPTLSAGPRVVRLAAATGDWVGAVEVAIDITPSTEPMP
jgi:hypothetical protein